MPSTLDVLFQNVTLLSYDPCANISINGPISCYYSLIFVDMTIRTSLSLNLILILVGLVSNILVVVVFCRNELRRLSVSVHTISLAISDISLLSIPVFLKWLNEKQPELALFQTDFWCHTHGYFDVSFCCWSAWNVVALSHERWIATCHPFVVYAKSTKSRSVFVSVLIPIITLVAFSWYPVLMVKRFSDYGDLICEPQDNELMLLFGAFTILITYVGPFGFITFFNCRIIRTLNEKIAKRKGALLSERRDRTSPNTYEMKKQESPLQQAVKEGTSSSSKPKQDRKLLNRKSTMQTDLEPSDENFSQSQQQNSPTIGSKPARRLTIRMSRKNSMAPSIGSRSGGSGSGSTNRRRSSVHETARCLDGHKRRSISAKTEILRTREQMNHLQRMKIDRSINVMLITVSVSFLVLTFPYQIIWVADRIFEFLLKKKLDRAREVEHLSEEAIDRIKREYGLYQLISFSLKDIALVLRNLNFSINFFLYSTMSNLFRQELNCILQGLGLYSFKLFKNELSTSTINSDYATYPTARSRILSFFSVKDRNTNSSRV